MRNAIDNEEITVLYQPIISLVTGAIKGFEALARWHHPERGPISPADFIPIAEDTGMIRQLGRLVLAESCRQMAAWQRQFGRLAPGFMCVNVSAGQFGDHDLAAEVERILDETGLEPSKLKLEITESAFLGDVGRAEATLASLQSMGVEWSIDDFGTGYSSLSYLHRLQANTVKVDRSFVSRMGIDAKGLGDGSCDRRAGAESRDGCRCRRSGKRRADGRAPNAWLRACPGLLLLAAHQYLRMRQSDRRAAVAGRSAAEA